MPVLATRVLLVAVAIGGERFPRRRWMAGSQVPPHRVIAPWRAGSCLQEEGLLWLPWRQSPSRLTTRESWQPMALTEEEKRSKGRDLHTLGPHCDPEEAGWYLTGVRNCVCSLGGIFSSEKIKNPFYTWRRSVSLPSYASTAASPWQLVPRLRKEESLGQMPPAPRGEDKGLPTVTPSSTKPGVLARQPIRNRGFI